MNTTIANVLCLLVGFASAFLLMHDSDGGFAPQKADGVRFVFAFFLCFFGGWFTKAESGSALLSVDWVAMAVLMLLALISMRWPPVA